MRRESRPAPTRRPSRTEYLEHTGDHRHEAPNGEDRADARVMAEAAERGYRLAVQCTQCGQWLTNPHSVSAQIGPVCRVRRAGVV